MKAAGEWLTMSGAGYRPGAGRTGTAHLRHYAARYTVWGQRRDQDETPLVLVHGLAGGMDLLGPLARVLSQDRQVITYQLRGEDDAFALRRRFGLPELVDDLAEFLDWFGLERPSLLGVSFGGVLALELAARRPSRIGALMTQGVGPRFEAGLLRQVAGFVLSRYPLPDDNPFVNQFFNLFFGGKQAPGPLFDFVTRQCWQTDQGIMAHRFALVEAAEPAARLQAVRVPALVLAGSRDLLVSGPGLEEMGKHLPRGRTVSIPKAGHLAFVTHADRVAAEVRAFLAEQA